MSLTIINSDWMSNISSGLCIIIPYCPEQAPIKRQKLRVGGYTEKVLEWFNYPRARAHPGCEVSCQGVYCIVTSCFVEASPIVEKAYRATKLTVS